MGNSMGHWKNAVKDNNKYLRMFNNESWDELLSSKILYLPSHKKEVDELDSIMGKIYNGLEADKDHDKHVGALFKLLLGYIQVIKSTHSIKEFGKEACNALYLIRGYWKYLIEKSDADTLAAHCSWTNDHGEDLMNELVNEIVSLVLEMDLGYDTMSLMKEALLSLITIMYSEIHHKNNKNKLSALIMDSSRIHAKILLAKLLDIYLIIVNPPKGYLATTISFVMPSFLVGNNNVDISVSNYALCLLLSLINSIHYNEKNEFRRALVFVVNNEDVSSNLAGVKLNASDALIYLSYSLCYFNFISRKENSLSFVLLYFMLYENKPFCIYVANRPDIQCLVLEMLKLINDFCDKKLSKEAVYILLAILLMLSENELFCENTHNIIIVNVPWYKERYLKDISLIGLMILTITRIVQFNLTSTKDDFIHSNTLAILANLSNHMQNLQPFVVRKLTGIFAGVAKRYIKMEDQYRRASGDDMISLTEKVEEQIDLPIYRDLIRLFLEIFNSALTNSLEQNTELIYAMLLEKDAFTRFRSHAHYGLFIENIDNLLTYFNAKILTLNKDSLHAHDILDIISHACKKWPIERMKEFPKLQYRYEEESASSEFFFPYLWKAYTCLCPVAWKTDESEINAELT